MKKVLLFITFLITGYSVAQDMMYTATEFRVKEGNESNIAKQLDSFFNGAKLLPNGGVVVEAIGPGWGLSSRGMTHRIVFLREIGAEGPMNQSSTQEERSINWAIVGDLVDEWGPQYSGRMLSWKPGDFLKNPYIQLWHIKLNSPSKFKSAHDKFFKSIGNYMDGKTIGFGTIDVGSPDGGTHWVAIASKNNGDLIKTHHDFNNKYSKQFSDWAENNGGVEIVDDFVVSIRRAYQ